jgi:hypothetical protein
MLETIFAELANPQRVACEPYLWIEKGRVYNQDQIEDIADLLFADPDLDRIVKFDLHFVSDLFPGNAEMILHIHAKDTSSIIKVGVVFQQQLFRQTAQVFIKLLDCNTSKTPNYLFIPTGKYIELILRSPTTSDRANNDTLWVLEDHFHKCIAVMPW